MTLWIKMEFITLPDATERINFTYQETAICRSCAPEDLRDKMFELEQFASIINPNIELKFMFKD